MAKTKILVVGIGGVGGYFGGLLAKHYQQSEEVEIYFLSRGKHLVQIQSKGLKVIDDQDEFVAHPHLTSDNGSSFETVDFVLLCTKTYHLEETLHQIRPCIKEKTVIIPLQNGVNNREIILQSMDSNLVTLGCIYLVSRLEAPGSIVKKGKVASLYFGLDKVSDHRLNHLQQLLLAAGIQSELTEAISKITWEKFIFLSSIATATTYFDANVHEVINDTKKLDLLKLLIQEVTQIALSKNIVIEKDQSQRVLNLLSSLPPGATTSMHSDFSNNKGNTELESLTGYVVHEGQERNISVPTFQKMYLEIKYHRSSK